MASTNVVAGGPAAAVTFVITTSTRSPNGVTDPSGATVCSSSINGNTATSTTPASGTQNGWTITANSDGTTGTVKAPASATIATPYIMTVGEGSNFGTATLNVVAADTTAPVPNTLSFNGTTGTLTWTETGSPPVLQVDTYSVSASGAGSSGDNITYIRSTTPDAFGDPFFRDASSGKGIVYANSQYQIRGVVSVAGVASGSYEYFGPSNSPALTFPLTGWTTTGSTGIAGSGTGNAPTFTAVGGTTMWGADQGLSFSTTGGTAGQLSGGAVTISNVVTSGTTTTFTTSRAIASSETGNFIGAAGAFSDSANPANLTAAFSIPITSSSFATPPARRNLTSVITF